MENKNFDGMEQPSWFDGKTIDEVAFCYSFLKRHPMKCIRGRLFTVDGLIEDEGRIQQLVLEDVMECQTIGISKKAKSLFEAVKMVAFSEPLPIETDRIHVANGTYFLNGTFTEDKTYCNNRMKVKYNPNAPQPQRWLHFLSELLVPEDIPTLQEYLGYCLIPSTKGQKMLMLIGKGGEGKSRIGLVMRAILGDSMNTISSLFSRSARLNRLFSTFWMLVVFMLSPRMERITSPMRLLPSPPLPMSMSIFCPLVEGIRQYPRYSCRVGMSSGTRSSDKKCSHRCGCGAFGLYLTFMRLLQ